jgi:hypothetical protein
VLEEQHPYLPGGGQPSGVLAPSLQGLNGQASEEAGEQKEEGMEHLGGQG